MQSLEQPHGAVAKVTRVAVIIPCFNHAHFLADAIESVVRQAWPHCDLIVVDDGSTDGSSEVAGRYSGIRLLTQSHAGLSAARNAGLRASDGDVVIFLDADDVLWPDAAGIAVRGFDTNPDAAMIVGRCRVVAEGSAPSETRPGQAHSYEALLRDNSIWTPAMAAFRRRVFDVVGLFDERNSPAADYDLYLRISRDFPVVSHDEIVVDYRQHDDNMSRDPVLMLEATLQVLREHRRGASADPPRAEACRGAMATWRECYGERLVERFRASLKQRRFWAACSDAMHLLRLYPAGVRHHLAKKLTLMLGRTASGTTP